MLKRIGLIGLTSAALTFVFVACGESVLPDEGCSTDSDCDTENGEICHPQAQVCVQSCTTSEDCPASAKTCEAIDAPADGGTGTGTLICKCSTDALCATENAGFVCSSAFEVCLNACSSNADCAAGSTCDTTSGQCVSGGGDAGTDAGVCGWDTCSTAEFVGAGGQQCTASGCAAGPSCAGTGRSTCDDGSACFQGACGFPPYPTPTDCENFYAGDHASGPMWNPATGMVPVIYLVEEISHGQGTNTGTPTGAFPFCSPTETQWNVRVRAYNPNGWPDTRAGLSGFFYVPTDGQDVDVLGSSLLRPTTGYNRTAGNVNDAEFQINLCSSATDALQPGFYFTGGNEACADI
jgi:hypothetical protein